MLAEAFLNEIASIAKVPMLEIARRAA